MSVTHTAVNVLLIGLFAAVGYLLLYGVYAYRPAPAPAANEDARTANPLMEVLWTSIAAALLLGVFLYAR